LVALRADDVDLDRDRTLVRRFQAGDDTAFDELYRRYYDRLERFCRKRVGDGHAAEEVTQEAFTRALTALPGLDGELRFYPWVSVIAARLCVDYHRRQSRSEPAADPDPGGVTGGQEDIIDAVDASLVVAALARLAPRHQDVLHLREVEGWSYQRIADHYGVKVGTVETLLFRARRALRREFHLVDGAGLAALPLVGRVVQWAGRVRNRIPEWIPSTPSTSTLAAAATASAAAVALAIVPAHLSANANAAAVPTKARVHAIAARPDVGHAGPTGVNPSPGVAPTGAASSSASQSAAASVPAATETSTPTSTTAPASSTRPVGPGPTMTTVAAPVVPPASLGPVPIAIEAGDPVLALVPPVTIPSLGSVTGALPNLPVPTVPAHAPDLATTFDPVVGTAQKTVTNLVGGVLQRNH
jgi:RNA polymerase sigma factor (sigma-70 family)